MVLHLKKSKQGRKRNVATTKKDPQKPINVIIITMKLGYFAPNAYYAHAHSRACLDKWYMLDLNNLLSEWNNDWTHPGEI